jgi:hypothetical protein
MYEPANAKQGKTSLFNRLSSALIATAVVVYHYRRAIKP